MSRWSSSCNSTDLDPGAVYFVLKTNESAALCWPLEQPEIGIWQKDKNAKQLEWYTCFDLDEVDVLTVRVLSPMNLLLEDCKLAVQGIQVENIEIHISETHITIAAKLLIEIDSILSFVALVECFCVRFLIDSH